MKTYCSQTFNAFSNDVMSICQWNQSALSGKNPANYLIVCKNPTQAYMQGVEPGNVHVECIVDDLGNLVKVAA